MNKSGYISLNSNYLLGEQSLKNAFFLFDNIYFDTQEYDQSKEFVTIGKHMVPRAIKEYGSGILDTIKSNISDVEFLLDKQMLVQVDPVQLERKLLKEHPTSNYSKLFLEFSNKASAYYLQSGAIISSITALSAFVQRENYTPVYENQRAIIVSDILTTYENQNVIPIFNPTSNFNCSFPTFTKEQTVLNVVLNKFPTINLQSLPWERIIDFKNDAETKTNQLRLRNWMTDISKGNLSDFEISEKLEYLIHEYKTHLKRHEFEFQYNIVKEVLITTAEIAEKIITLKFSEALKAIFNIGKHKMKLIDIKENAPGKEVALFHQINSYAKIN